MTDRVRRLVPVLVLAIIILYSGHVISGIYAGTHGDLHDFNTYYFAATAARDGQNPYVTANLTTLSNGLVRYPFIYPPPVLNFFKLFTPFGLKSAQAIYLTMKLCLLTVVILLWHYVFLNRPSAWFYLFCLLAFNSPIHIDLAVGNISLVEQFLIWLGFYFFITRRYSLFCSALLLASIFKFTPMLFLLLLFSRHGPKKPFRYIGISLAVLTALMTISVVRHPDFYSGMIHSLTRVQFKGAPNPATLALVKDLEILVFKWTGFLPAAGVKYVAVAVTALSVWFLSIRIIRRYEAGNSSPDPRVTVFFACLVYAVSIPRFPDYSYILLLAPAWFVITRFKISGGVLLFVVSILHLSTSRLPGYSDLSALCYAYHPLLLAYGFLGILIHGLTRRVHQ